MDFSQQRAQQAPARASSGGQNTSSNNKKNGAWRGSPMWLKIIWVILLFSATVLAVAMVFLLYVGGNEREEKIVDDTKFQAVFLTNGQVYFGNVTAVNDKYLDLKNIYYLSVNQTVQPEQKTENDQQAQVSLVKLGCELHGPVDEMVINRDQVTFWENLKTDGQVSQAIDKWVEQNPEGQKCNTDAQSSLEFSRKES